MNVLIIAPHPDDEVLGCGGTIAKRASQGHNVYVCVVTKGGEPLFHEKDVEQVRSECREADRLLGVKETFFLDYPAVRLEEVPRYLLNNGILKAVQSVRPDEVYLPHRGDMQLDHKMIVDAAMVALRPKYEHVISRIYSYETLSETGWDLPNVVNEFIPTVYEDISDTLRRNGVKIPEGSVLYDFDAFNGEIMTATVYYVSGNTVDKTVAVSNENATKEEIEEAVLRLQKGGAVRGETLSVREFAMLADALSEIRERRCEAR